MPRVNILKTTTTIVTFIRDFLIYNSMEKYVLFKRRYFYVLLNGEKLIIVILYVDLGWTKNGPFNS